MADLESILYELQTNAAAHATVLRGCMSVSGMARLANRIKGNRVIRQLHLNSCHITDAHAELLAEALKHATIKTVNLGHNSITGAGACALIRAANQCQSLISLSLYGNNLGDLGAMQLAPFLKDLHLEKLDLGKNNISDIGAEMIANYLGSSKIRDFSLAGNLLTDNGGAAMAKAVKNSAYIERLDLSDNEAIDIKSLQAFQSAIRTHRSIRLVSLSPGTNISPEMESAYLQPLLKQLQSYHTRVFTVLCTPASVERLGRTSPLRNIPTDILRLIAEAILDST